VAEQQAHWVAEQLSGDYVLPDPATLSRMLARQRQELFDRYVRSRRHTMQVDPERYLSELLLERERGRRRAQEAFRAKKPGEQRRGV
jgi:hypothetical protein